MKINGKKLVLLLSFAVVLFLYQFVFLPGKKKLCSLESLTAKKVSDYTLLKTLCEKYKKSLESKTIFEPEYADKRFSLLSFLGEIIEEMKLKNNMKEVKPLPQVKKNNLVYEKVKLTITDISLEKVYAFLQKIENSNNFVYISNFQMKKNRKNPFLLSIVMELLIIKNI